MNDKATSPYLNQPLESEATTRRRFECAKLGIAYVPPHDPQSTRGQCFDPAPPWDGHCEDVLFHDGTQNQISPRLVWFAWGAVAAVAIGTMLALWP